jgi:hypothetical protein
VGVSARNADIETGEIVDGATIDWDTEGTPTRNQTARRSNHPATFAGVVIWTYGWAIHYGALRANDSAVRAIEEAVQTAEASSNNVAVSLSAYTLAVALLSRDAAADRHRGLELMVQARDIWLRKQIALQMAPVTELWAARERAGGGDRNAAIPVMRKAVDELHQAVRLGYGVWGTGLLVETLLERGAEGDLAEAQEAIDWLANLPADGSAIPEITLLRLRALLTRARGENAAYRDLVSRYREMAESLGFQGHIAWANAMT